jgi:hypothetical protein
MPSSETNVAFEVGKDVVAVPALSFAMPQFAAAEQAESTRTQLAMFAGRSQGLATRTAVFRHYIGHPDFTLLDGRLTDEKYASTLLITKFCLHIKGTRGVSPRLVEFIWFGCVPVVLADNYHLPHADVLDWSQFSVQIEEGDIGQLHSRLLAEVDNGSWARKQAMLQRVLPFFTYNKEPVFGDAFWMTMLVLRRNMKKRLDTNNACACRNS